jgi:hypothetical protein
VVEYHYDGGSAALIHQKENTWNPEHRLERRVVCSPYRHAKRALFLFPWLGYPDAPERFGLPLVCMPWMNGFNHGQSFRRWDRFDTVHASGLLPLVVLCHSSYSKQSRRFGLHHEFLHFVDCLDIATLTGLKDALLHSVNCHL